MNEEEYNAAVKELEVYKDICKFLKTNDPVKAVNKLVEENERLRQKIEWFKQKGYEDKQGREEDGPPNEAEPQPAGVTPTEDATNN